MYFLKVWGGKFGDCKVCGGGVNTPLSTPLDVWAYTLISNNKKSNITYNLVLWKQFYLKLFKGGDLEVKNNI